MDGELYTIGQLAERTCLAVKTIRFYSDSGLVPPAARSQAGYRLYDATAYARLDLVRTLRDLGLDLATIRRVLEQEVSVADIAQAHADALAVQIKTLRLRRSVLLAVARRGSTHSEVELMNSLARQPAQERHRLINDFIDTTFSGLDANPNFVSMMRSAMPDLPEDPAPEQVEAWVELADLVGDPDFRASVRRMAEVEAEHLAPGDSGGSTEAQRLFDGELRESASEALASGLDPTSPRSYAVVERVMARYCEAFGRPDDDETWRRFLTRLEVSTDERAERYWQLLAVINGWPQQPALTPVFAWFAGAMRAGIENRRRS